MKIEIGIHDFGTYIEIDGAPQLGPLVPGAEARTSGPEAPAEIRSVPATAERKICELVDRVTSCIRYGHLNTAKKHLREIRKLCSNEN